MFGILRLKPQNDRENISSEKTIKKHSAHRIITKSSGEVMKTILIILGILLCINILVMSVSKVFADDMKSEYPQGVTLSSID